jgi:hypothetical protein
MSFKLCEKLRLSWVWWGKFNLRNTRTFSDYSEITV